MLPFLHTLKKGSKKAGDGNRTHVSSLEGWCSTIELHPHQQCSFIIAWNFMKYKYFFKFF